MNPKEAIEGVSLNQMRKAAKKPPRIPFDKLTFGHTFEVKGVGKATEWFYCAFCGGRGKNYVLIRRVKDGLTLKVGRTCLARVGLVLPEEMVNALNPKAVVVDVDNEVKPEQTLVKDEIDEEIANLLSTI